MLTAAALTGFKDHVKRHIAYARYKVGNTWYRVDNINAYTATSGYVNIDFMIDPALTGEITISQVQLYDTAGALWADKAESIVRRTTQEGVFYRFQIAITEV